MMHPRLMYKVRTLSTALTSTQVDVYTTPQQYEADVASILFSNSGGATAVTMILYDKGLNTDFVFLGSYNVPAYGIFQIENAMWLAKGDKIRCSAVAANVTITLVVKELYSPQTF